MPLEKTNPYLVVPNARTGRLEYYEDRGGREFLVGSTPGYLSDEAILAFCRRLAGERK
jgi:hypothetical protein